MNPTDVNGQQTKMELDPYALLTLNVGVELQENLMLELIAHNLLFQDYDYPEYIRRNIPAVPGGPPASVFGKVTLKY
jgi:hypothetical protein